MAAKIEFTKMHGAGNDYIYVNTLKYPISNPEKVSKLWSDRHKGIGGDGLVLIGKGSEDADFSMRIFNNDGSEAMSGDIAFEPELQRCIGVDIRYVLFMIDKWGKCPRLIQELKLVK